MWGGPDTAPHAATATRPLLTGEGVIVGTMPYMSPEQVAGERIDHRSDVFSLGVMFYEMLTGVRPFQGVSSPLLMSAILRDTPERLDTVRPDVPAPLAGLIGRCLEKHPEHRVQTARAIHDELRLIQRQAPEAARTEQAIEETTRAVELDPANWAAHHVRGEALLAAGRTPEAIAAFEASVRVAPWNARSALLLAALQARQTW